MTDFYIETCLVDGSDEEKVSYKIGDIVRVRTNDYLEEITGRIKHIDIVDKDITLDCSSEFKSSERRIRLHEIFDICLIKG